MKRSVLTVAVMIAVAIAAAPQGSHSSGRESLRGLKQLHALLGERSELVVTQNPGSAVVPMKH
jgi:hypothetical protein